METVWLDIGPEDPFKLKGKMLNVVGVQVARRAMARAKGERHVPTGFFVCCDTREKAKLYAPDIVG